MEQVRVAADGVVERAFAQIKLIVFVAHGIRRPLEQILTTALAHELRFSLKNAMHLHVHVHAVRVGSIVQYALHLARAGLTDKGDLSTETHRRIIRTRFAVDVLRNDLLVFRVPHRLRLHASQTLQEAKV